MSVYVDKLPKNCGDCRLRRVSFDLTTDICCIINRNIDLNKRDKKCPLIQLNTSIDKGELK